MKLAQKSSSLAQMQNASRFSNKFNWNFHKLAHFQLNVSFVVHVFIFIFIMSPHHTHNTVIKNVSYLIIKCTYYYFNTMNKIVKKIVIFLG